MRDSNSRGVAPNMLSKCVHQRPPQAGTVRDVRLSIPPDRAGRPRTQAVRPQLSPGPGLLYTWRPSGWTGLIVAGAVVTEQIARSRQRPPVPSAAAWGTRARWPLPAGQRCKPPGPSRMVGTSAPHVAASPIRSPHWRRTWWSTAKNSLSMQAAVGSRRRCAQLTWVLPWVPTSGITSQSWRQDLPRLPLAYRT